MSKEIELEELSELEKILSDNEDCDLFWQEETKSCTMEVIYDDCSECRAARVQEAGFRKAENVAKETATAIFKEIRKHYPPREKITSPDDAYMLDRFAEIAEKHGVKIYEDNKDW